MPPVRSKKGNRAHRDGDGPSARPNRPTSDHKRGPWNQTEDEVLLKSVNRWSVGKWVEISNDIGNRTPKQCRERWHQNLDPTLDHGPITEEEGILIEHLVRTVGKKWAEIARQLHHRSDNAVKNWWNGGQNRRRRNEENARHTTTLLAAPVHSAYPSMSLNPAIAPPSLPMSTGYASFPPPLPARAHLPPPPPMPARPNNVSLPPIQVPNHSAAEPSMVSPAAPSLISDRSEDTTPANSPAQQCATQPNNHCHSAPVFTSGRAHPYSLPNSPTILEPLSATSLNRAEEMARGLRISGHYSPKFASPRTEGLSVPRPQSSERLPSIRNGLSGLGEPAGSSADRIRLPPLNVDNVARAEGHGRNLAHGPQGPSIRLDPRHSFR